MGKRDAPDRHQAGRRLKVGIYGDSTGGHFAILLAMRPREAAVLLAISAFARPGIMIEIQGVAVI
jgi:hypothetical protein